MELLVKLLIVLGIGAVTLWVAIPTGLVLELNPLLTGTAAAAGAILGVAIILVLGERVRRWYRGDGRDRRHGRIYRICTSLGVAGFGLLSPFLLGAPLGTAVGVALGLPNRRLLLWMSLGIIILSALATLAAVLGVIDARALRF